jgi:predicted nucleic acid-binding protein
VNGYLIDTNVVSALFRRPPDVAVLGWFAKHSDESRLYLSVITIREIRKGVAALPAQRRPHGEAIERWLERDLLARFAGRVVSIDVPIASLWGQMMGEAKRRGASLPDVDCLLVASARIHGLAVVTRNVRDIARMNVPVEDPWSA